MEAMSFGILVIANDIPGVNSLVKKNHSGILIDNNKSELYIREISKIISNRKLLNKYSDRCLSIVKKYDRDDFLKYYSKLLYSIQK